MTIATVKITKLFFFGSHVRLSEYGRMKEDLIRKYNLKPRNLIKVFVPAVGDRIFELNSQLDPIDSNQDWWSYGEGPTDQWEHESNYKWVEHHEHNLISYYVEDSNEE